MSDLYCAIMTEETVNVIKDSLKLCIDAIMSKMPSVAFNEGYNSKNYCELCLQYVEYVILLTDIEIAMNHDNEKNDRFISNIYSAKMTKDEIDVIMRSFKTSMDIIEHKISLAELDPSYDDMYYCELCSEYDKYEEILNRIKSAINS